MWSALWQAPSPLPPISLCRDGRGRRAGGPKMMTVTAIVVGLLHPGAGTGIGSHEPHRRVSMVGRDDLIDYPTLAVIPATGPP